MNYETAKEIEIRLAYWFGIRKYVTVPNVSWGLLPYEADLLILTRSGYVWEVEIKVSRGDLLRDRKKRHQHDSRIVRQLWFAIPERIHACCVEHVPEKAGILVLCGDGSVKEVRKTAVNRSAPRLTDNAQFRFARLGALRIWSLKEKNLKLTATHLTLTAELLAQLNLATLDSLHETV